jgi:hypothetical protein
MGNAGFDPEATVANGGFEAPPLRDAPTAAMP